MPDCKHSTRGPREACSSAKGTAEKCRCATTEHEGGEETSIVLALFLLVHGCWPTRGPKRPGPPTQRWERASNATHGQPQRPQGPPVHRLSTSPLSLVARAYPHFWLSSEGSSRCWSRGGAGRGQRWPARWLPSLRWSSMSPHSARRCWRRVCGTFRRPRCSRGACSRFCGASLSSTARCASSRPAPTAGSRPCAAPSSTRSRPSET